LKGSLAPSAYATLNLLVNNNNKNIETNSTFNPPKYIKFIAHHYRQNILKTF